MRSGFEVRGLDWMLKPSYSNNPQNEKKKYENEKGGGQLLVRVMQTRLFKAEGNVNDNLELEPPRVFWFQLTPYEHQKGFKFSHVAVSWGS